MSMTNNRLRAIALVGAVVALAPIGLSAQQPFSHELALATFDAAWQRVYDTHFDTTFNGVDWLALRDELRPRVDTATHRETLRSAIREMLARLGQSHFALIPQEVADTLDLERIPRPDTEPFPDLVRDDDLPFR